MERNEISSLDFSTRTTALLICGALALCTSLSFAIPHSLSLEIDDPKLVTESILGERKTSSVNWGGEQPLPKPPVTPKFAAPRPLRVFLDPGHGGRDRGAPGLYGLLEKELALKLSKMVATRLKQLKPVSDRRLELKTSRDIDEFLTLKDRVELANSWEADVFVSIHANSSPVAKAEGFEVYFLSNYATDAEASRLARVENREEVAVQTDVQKILSDVQTNFHISESSIFAESIFRKMSAKIRSSGRGVRQAPFSVLAGTNMPSVLIEIGYVTNNADARRLSKPTYLKLLADAISSGIEEYLVQQVVRKVS